MKTWVSKLLVMLMVVSISVSNANVAFGDASAPTAASKKTFLTDISGHWAEKTIEKFAAEGMVQGYENGSFQPNGTMKRAELITVINQLFGFQETGAVSAADVTPDDWFYTEVAKAQKAGYITGYTNGRFKPEQAITRQETAVLIAHMLDLEVTGSSNAFTDTVNSPEWSKGAIGAVTEAGVMQGYNENIFKPTAQVTRAEAVVILDRAYQAKNVAYDKAGVYGPETDVEKINQNVVINVPSVTLQNMDIQGNLLIGRGVGEGDVTLKNVKVHGTTTVQGGGENSIHFEDSIMVTVVVDKVDGKVRIVVNGSTQIADVTVQSNAKIEAQSSAEINKVTLSEALPQASNVQLVGSFETVNVIAKSIVVDIPKGSIKDLNVDSAAAGTKLDLGREASIVTLIMNAAINVAGQGTVQSATVNAEGISMEKPASNMKVGSDVAKEVKLKIGGKDVAANDAKQPASTPSASGSLSNDSSNSDSGSTGSGSTGSGNNSGEQPGGGIDIHPLPTGDVPVLSSVTKKATVTESVYAVSDMDGWVYIVESGTTRSQIGLEEAVRGGIGKKEAVKANQGVYIDTTGLSKTKVTFLVIALSAEGQVSYPEFIKLYAGKDDALEYSGTSQSGRTNSSIIFNFNKEIQNHLPDLEALKAAITFSVNHEPFQPLHAEDEIRLYANSLEVVFAVPYSGEANKLHLNASVIQDTYGNVYDREVTTSDIKAGLNVQLVSDKRVFAVGDEIAVRVNQRTTVYLVPSAVRFNTLFDVENEVVAKRGTKVTVAEQEPDQDVMIPTADLTPGSYSVLVWPGNSVHITLQ
ncbi:S-layer homology domain-containing protein [Paenibacillus sp. OSY-SE]|uniref:S-layer homology domain-containing protein n=1 Tax=Paenibacillus sp. OSY-SE TaxID=1196323 RepID=UPI0002E8DCFF|nr:S-layer homology domain-containing protein [Paenibacillus sp. OSY-SE]